MNIGLFWDIVMWALLIAAALLWIATPLQRGQWRVRPTSPHLRGTTERREP